MHFPTKILFFLFSCFLLFTHAMFLEFPAGWKLSSGDTKHWWTAIYSTSDSPVGNAVPDVGLELLIIRDSVEDKGHLDILIYDTNSAKYVGANIDNTIEYCCRESDCTGDALYQAEPGIEAIKVEFGKGNSTANVQRIFKISQTGIYILQISNCKGNGVGTVELQGSAVWRNPYGYLPGDVFMGLVATGVLALCNLFVLVAYVFLFIKYRHLLMTLQYGILGLLIFELLESSAWFFYKIGLNNIGHYSTVALLFLVFLASSKKTVARILVLLLSMGMGTVKWTLDGTTRMKVAYLSVCYMFFTFLLQMINQVEALEKREILSDLVKLLVIIPAAVLDTLFYYWIILSLIRTTQQLTLRRQALKLQMYKSFLGVLIVTGILALITFIYQIYCKILKIEIPWQRVWITESSWDFLFFLVVASIAFLWRPRANNSRYGYAEFFTDQDEAPQGEENQETIVINGELTHRKKMGKDKKQEITEDRNMNLTDFEKGLLSIDLSPEDDKEASLETEVKKMD